jgi:hypothetical protein
LWSVDVIQETITERWRRLPSGGGVWFPARSGVLAAAGAGADVMVDNLPRIVL